MGNTLPPLTNSVLVGSTAYRAGDIPPLKDARRITNKRNWPDGQVPDFDNGGYEDGVETVDGIGNADAANAGRTGLPGFNPDGTPKQQLVEDTTGGREQLLKRTGGEGAGLDQGADQGGDPAGDGGDPGGDGGDPGGDPAGDGGDPGAAATATTPGAGAPATSRTPRKRATATPA